MDFKFYKGFSPTENKPLKKPLPQKFGVRSTDDIIKDRYRRNALEPDKSATDTKNESSFDYQQRMQSQRRLSNLDK